MNQKEYFSNKSVKNVFELKGINFLNIQYSTCLCLKSEE